MGGHHQNLYALPQSMGPFVGQPPTFQTPGFGFHSAQGPNQAFQTHQLQTHEDDEVDDLANTLGQLATSEPEDEVEDFEIAPPAPTPKPKPTGAGNGMKQGGKQSGKQSGTTDATAKATAKAKADEPKSAFWQRLHARKGKLSAPPTPAPALPKAPTAGALVRRKFKTADDLAQAVAKAKVSKYQHDATVAALPQRTDFSVPFLDGVECSVENKFAGERNRFETKDNYRIGQRIRKPYPGMMSPNNRKNPHHEGLGTRFGGQHPRQYREKCSKQYQICSPNVIPFNKGRN